MEETRTPANPAAPDAGSAPAAVAAPPAPPAAAPRPLWPWLVQNVLLPASDLRIAVACFAAGIFLVFAGTLAQVDMGIWTAVARYFRSLWVFIPLQIFFPRSMDVSGGFFFPGGWLIGAVFLVNLVCAHIVTFKLNWSRAGILLIHAGIVVMLLGEIVTGLFAVEGNMTIDEGSSSNYVEHVRSPELAVIDPSSPTEDAVTAVSRSMLRTGAVITHEALPFDIEVTRFMSNSQILGPAQAGSRPNPATAGDGLQRIAVERPEVSGADPEQTIDVASAYLTLKRKNGGETLGTWLASLWLDPQHVTLDGKVYRIALRHQRSYKPFSLELIDFKHERYIGTDIPKDFSSRVRLRDPARNVDREVLIYMNNPLRYAGETFYQASFKRDESGTILQVVRNPGWLLPYLSCIMVAAGMTWHFGVRLLGFLRRRAA